MGIQVGQDKDKQKNEEFIATVIANFVFGIVALFILAALYWGGAVMGGFWAGMLNIVVSLLIVGVLYLRKQQRNGNKK